MEKLVKLLKNPYLYLTLILVLGFLLRLYKIDNPIADWHSWRQADTAAVARNFYKEGFNPFLPRGDDMSSISEIKPQLNLNRYRFVEFPIYPSLVYFGYLLNGGVDERIARLVSVLFSLGSMTFIYFIVKKNSTTVHALLSSLIFATLPFSIYYSRVTLPEPSLIFFSLGMFYFVDRWISENEAGFFSLGKKTALLVLSIFFTACAFLTKPMAVFFLMPLCYSYFKKEGFRFPALRYWLLIIVALVPFGLWRIWMQNFAEGIPASSWLLNGNGIRLRPAFFRWLVGDRLGREILSITGGALFLLGLVIKPLAKSNYLLHLLTLSSFLYLVVFATGNVQHDYYQYLLIPVLSIFLARGVWLLFQGFPFLLPRIISIPLAIFLLGITYYLTWYEVKGLYQVNNWAIVHGGVAADKLLPKDALVVAPYMGDTAFLYQTNRHGFPIINSTVEEMKKDYGITGYVSTTNDTKTAWLAKKYNLLEKTDEYIVIDLTKINPDFTDKDSKEPL
ncbi:MAG TPA: glycosyltransferase family 39 protein [Patescibacteria group bacterium]|nr:glycosyltransferase family 39 protein [Patescibacteria group bacterium]